MYGVPKFKESFFMKYKKEVFLSVGAFLTIATVVQFSPKQDMLSVRPIDDNGVVIEREAPVVGYQIVYNGKELGVIAQEEDLDELLDVAYQGLVKDLGYDPEIVPEPALIPVREGALTLDTKTIAVDLQNELYNSLDVIKQKGYVMRIGDDFTVVLESEQAVKEVLANAQRHFIKTDIDLEIDLDLNEYNSMVLTPKVLMKDMDSEPIPLVTASQEAASNENETDDGQEALANQGKMVAVEFSEDIAVVETYINPKDIVDIEMATGLITKENEKAKVYAIQAGDSPSVIASANDMKLSELYAMNPGLKEKERSIQIGDEVVVMVPEPEIKVETKLELVYTEPIERSVVYQKDPNVYVGSENVIENGSDGTMEITALVTQINGAEDSREIISKKVIEEPKDKIISKGSKPFPVKGATGNYIFPVSGYRISSPYGPRWGSFHRGVDLAVSYGTEIVAADGGTIIFAGWKSSTYGYFVEIDHGDGVTTRYAHASKVNVKVGQEVAQGQKIAEVGSTGRSTGPHVHFEIRFDGETANPINYLE